MDCCVLSQEEVGRLRNYGIQPSHKDHRHIDSKVAVRGIQDDSYEIVDLGDGRYAVTETKIYFLQRRKSGHLDTIQRVVSNHVSELRPAR